MLLQAVALAFVIWSKRWGALSGIGFLVLATMFLPAKPKLPSFVTFMVVMAAVLSAGGWAWEWFSRVVWFDDFMHFFAPFAIMSALGLVAWQRNWLKAEPGGGTSVFSVTLAGLVLGIGWEVAEAIFLSLAWTDTILDLVMDTLGAAAAGWFAGWVAVRCPPAIGAAAKLPLD